MSAARIFRSIGWRLTAMLGVIALAVFSAAGTLLYWVLERELIRQETDEISGKVALVQHVISELKAPADLEQLAHHLDDMLVGHGALRVWIARPDGHAVYGGKVPRPIRTNDDGFVSLRREGDAVLRGSRIRLAPNAALPSAEVIVAVDTGVRTQLLRTYRNVLILMCGLGIVVTVVASRWAIQRGLAPVDALSRQASKISPHALSLRLPAEGVDHELQSLAQSFNQVLDRLQAAYQHLDAFNADVAHELRTPLATVINGTQIALSATRSAAELREVLASNLEDLEQLNCTINDMLFLARADQGEIAQDTSFVSLSAETRHVAEYLEAAVEERGVQLEIRGDAAVPANASLVRRALVNLVTNALCYTLRGESICIAIDELDGTARVVVRNPGPSIAAEDLPRLFDRFYRTVRARTAGVQGSGLGLAIVRAIARMHGGDAFATSREGVTEIGFTLGKAVRPSA